LHFEHSVCIPRTLREQQKQCEAGRPTLTLLSKIVNDPDEKRSESVGSQMRLLSENSVLVTGSILPKCNTTSLRGNKNHCETSRPILTLLSKEYRHCTVRCCCCSRYVNIALREQQMHSENTGCTPRTVVVIVVPLGCHVDDRSCRAPENNNNTIARTAGHPWPY